MAAHCLRGSAGEARGQGREMESALRSLTECWTVKGFSLRRAHLETATKP